MARQKYRKKPEFWDCIQYSGTNSTEMTSFCYLCSYDPATQKLFFNLVIVQPTYWIMQDNAGNFSMLDDAQFKAFFEITSGPPT